MEILLSDRISEPVKGITDLLNTLKQKKLGFAQHSSSAKKHWTDFIKAWPDKIFQFA